MRLVLSLFLLIRFLEVYSQQLPENVDYSSTHLRIENNTTSTDFKVLRGTVRGYDQLHNTPAIIGTFHKDESHTTFTPLVPFDQETPYTLVYNKQAFVFQIPRSAVDVPMSVTSIYPATAQVPANILKWYIEFSKPVNPVKIYEHIQFFDQDGKAIDRSILHLAAPLLSADGTLLTVWIEPGRQKRLLGPNKHLGSVFEPAKQYTLQIAGTLKDAKGLPIGESITHHFTTTESDRIKPSIAEWQILPLQANSQTSLTITTNELLDYGSLIDAISVSYEGEQIDGTLSYDSLAKTIYFKPIEHWEKGSYTIHIETQLEDLAGNNLLHLFDRPLKEGHQKKATPERRLSVDCF